jgi:hypothetical protein
MLNLAWNLVKHNALNIAANTFFYNQSYQEAKGQGQSFGSSVFSGIKDVALFSLFPNATLTASFAQMPVALANGLQQAVYQKSMISRARMSSGLGSSYKDYRDASAVRSRGMEQMRQTNMIMNTTIGNEAALMFRQYG